MPGWTGALRNEAIQAKQKTLQAWPPMSAQFGRQAHYGLMVSVPGGGEAGAPEEGRQARRRAGGNWPRAHALPGPPHPVPARLPGSPWPPVGEAHLWARTAHGRPPAGSPARSCTGASPPPPGSSARSRRCPPSSWRSAPLSRRAGGAQGARGTPGPGPPPGAAPPRPLRPRVPAPHPSPCRQKRPSQPPAQSQWKEPMPSMHLPCPQHVLSQGCSGGGDAHWSSSAMWREGVSLVPPALFPTPPWPRAPRGHGTAVRGLELTHRGTWTRRPAVERRLGVRGRRPFGGIWGAHGTLPGSGPGEAGQPLRGQVREGLPKRSQLPLVASHCILNKARLLAPWCPSPLRSPSQRPLPGPWCLAAAGLGCLNPRGLRPAGPRDLEVGGRRDGRNGCAQGALPKSHVGVCWEAIWGKKRGI